MHVIVTSLDHGVDIGKEVEIRVEYIAPRVLAVGGVNVIVEHSYGKAGLEVVVMTCINDEQEFVFISVQLQLVLVNPVFEPRGVISIVCRL